MFNVKVKEHFLISDIYNVLQHLPKLSTFFSQYTIICIFSQTITN